MQSDDYNEVDNFKKEPSGGDGEDGCEYFGRTKVDTTLQEKNKKGLGGSNRFFCPLRKYKKIILETENGDSIENNSLNESKKTNSVNFNLFKNPKSQKNNLILKRTNKNIRLGYKKILKKDLSYDELYREENVDRDEFLCCKEYKKYVDHLFLSHQEESCYYTHKDGLDYLKEVACNELLLGEDNTGLDCEKVVKCPFNFCKDTFCYQCDLCRSQELEEHLTKNKKSE